MNKKLRKKMNESSEYRALRILYNACLRLINNEYSKLVPSPSYSTEDAIWEVYEGVQITDSILKRKKSK